VLTLDVDRTICYLLTNRQCSPALALDLARNVDTPVDVLTDLAYSSSWLVRAETAGHRHCPEAIVQRLARDEDARVAEVPQEALGAVLSA